MGSISGVANVGVTRGAVTDGVTRFFPEKSDDLFFSHLPQNC